MKPVDLLRAYGHREFLLQSVESQNKQAAQQIELERSQLERIKREHQSQALANSELQLQVQKLSGEALCLRQENELMRDKLERCMDYDFVKQENKMLLYKLEVSKGLIGERAATARSTARSRPSKQPEAYVPQRKRSVTFASEAGEVPRLALDDKSEMGADNDLVFMDQSELSRRDEGERLLQAEVEERAGEEAALLAHADGELRQLCEMQVFEQRRLQQTVDEVKRQVEFLYVGVADSGQSNTEPALDTSLGFLEAAKERLRYLESEGSCVESRYRDYEHRVKSKHYPLVETGGARKADAAQKANLDVERFMEATMRASMQARLVREELDQDVAKTAEKTHKVVGGEQERRVEELVRSVRMVAPAETQAIRKQLWAEQGQLASLKSDFRAVVEGVVKQASSEQSSSTSVVIPRKQQAAEEDDR